MEIGVGLGGQMENSSLPNEGTPRLLTSLMLRVRTMTMPTPTEWELTPRMIGFTIVTSVAALSAALLRYWSEASN
jgi:hypothetical protein